MASDSRRSLRLIILQEGTQGIDHRVVEALVDDEISIGDYILTNGAIAQTSLPMPVVRLLPGVLGDDAGAAEDSLLLKD